MLNRGSQVYNSLKFLHCFIICVVGGPLHEFQCHFLKRLDVSAHSLNRRGQIRLQAIDDVAPLLPRHVRESARRRDAFIDVIRVDVMDRLK